MKRTDLNSEERTFLELIAMNVWQARRQGAIAGAAYVLGVELLLYLIMDVGVLDPMSSFLYAGVEEHFLELSSTTEVRALARTSSFFRDRIGGYGRYGVWAVLPLSRPQAAIVNDQLKLVRANLSNDRASSELEAAERQLIDG